MAKRKILVLSPLPEVIVEALFKAKASPEEAEDMEVVIYQGDTKQELLDAVAGSTVIIGDYTFNITMDADVMQAAKGCLLIQQPSTGYQHIDIEAAADQGIPVANVAGANTDAVAEHTMMMILACLKKLLLSHGKTMAGEWAQDEMATYGVFELLNKTLGIIGIGRIGIEVAKRARAFGPIMIYFDVNRLAPEQERELGLTYRPLDELIAESDVITLHTPLTPETENLIDVERIGRMKPNAIIINVARGAILDESALAAALKEGRLQGAGLDVFATEPISKHNPLLDAPNVVLTPHIAGATNESRLRIIDLSLNNVVSVLSGEIPVNVINDVEPHFE